VSLIELGARNGWLDGFVAWVESTPMAVYISENSYAFPWLECLHVMSIGLVLGVISIVDLRLMGLASHGYPTSRLLRTLLPLTWIAFAAAFVTGSLMFTSQPGLYLVNTAFRIKLALLVLAGLNMAFFHLWTQRRVAQWEAEDRMPRSAKAAGFVSLCIWLGVVFAGRFVGFTIDAFGSF
jgi:hypothetical protein